MDPEANLREQREIAARLLSDDNLEWDTEGDVEKALRLAELVQAMDEWLKKGGFLPTDWRNNR